MLTLIRRFHCRASGWSQRSVETADTIAEDVEMEIPVEGLTLKCKGALCVCILVHRAVSFISGEVLVDGV